MHLSHQGASANVQHDLFGSPFDLDQQKKVIICTISHKRLGPFEVLKR